LGAIGVVAAGILAAIFLRGGGGSGSGGTGTGAGPGTGPGASTQVVVPAQPQRPLKVTIRENSYVVNGQSVDLVKLLDMAANVPPGEGAAVAVERSGSSRARAEEELFTVLDKRGVKYQKD